MTSITPVNQIVFIIVQERQAENLMQALSQARFFFTRIDSTGLVFQEATVCLMIGLNSGSLPALMALVGEHCRPYQEFVPVQYTPPAGFPPLPMIEARVGGALVYILDVERFEQY